MSLSGEELRAGAHSVAVALLAHLRQARDHIDHNYREPLDLDRLAQVAGVSKYQFARSFEATYGETPIRYVTRRRTERAQDLLRVANLTVTEVCMAFGFTNLGSFSARFTQLVGETPTAYRDRRAARGGPHGTTDWNAHRAPCDRGVDAGDAWAGVLVTASVSGPWRGGNTCPTLGATRPVGTERDTT